MLASDTIAALATPPGRAARALLRIAGQRAHEALAPMCESPPSAPGPQRVRLRLPAGELPALAIRFDAPRSYTGEDAIELLIPGAPALVDRVLSAILDRPGVRRAEPGEFTARAYLSGRLSLTQAEGVAFAIAAESDAQLEAAADLLRGEAGDRYARWADSVAHLLALVEAGIDFTDQEDVTAIPSGRLLASAAELASEIHTMLSRDGEAPEAAARVRACIAGAPNAGKSTLFNALLNRRRSVVSETPGATRDAIEEPLDLSGQSSFCPPVTLIDLAGLDEALASRSAVDSLAQSRARAEIARADILLHCDPAGVFVPSLRASARQRVLFLRTKADLPAGSDGPSILPVCALDGRNLRHLRAAIADAAASSARSAALTVLPRHRAALAAAAVELEGAAALVADDPPAAAPSRPELVAQRLREALDQLGQLVGRVHPDDLLARIFASFCVGK